MTEPANAYYQVTCPHCQRAVCIRLHPNETLTTLCQCKRVTQRVVWNNHEQRDGTTAYGPQLLEEA